MTPREVLEDAARRFMVLYHNDPEALRRLLRQALGKYQDKAGWICESRFSGDAVPVPERSRGIASVSDCAGRFVPWHVEDGDVVLDPLDKNRCPYVLHWFADLRIWPMDDDLPGDCAAMVGDYLEALIAVQNTQRERSAMVMTGQNAADLPSVSGLRQRIAELEQSMEENKAMVIPASYF